jgi:hypothetical protein
MPTEYPEKIKLYDHIPNSGIVHLPNRRFPAVAIQGDSLSIILSEAAYFMDKAKEYDDENMFYAARDLAERLKSHLERYESVLKSEGIAKPYTTEICSVNVETEFENYS